MMGERHRNMTGRNNDLSGVQIKPSRASVRPRNRTKPPGGPRTGRVQRQIRRAFIASLGSPLSSSDLLKRAYPRLSSYASWQYRQVREAAARWAVRTGKAATHGTPIMWKPRLGIGHLLGTERKS